jgi:uncharacterized protein (DUF4415 family)
LNDDKPKRLSLAEKRAMQTPLNLGPEMRNPESGLQPISNPVNQFSDLNDVMHKKPISLRVDPDVLDFFKAQGPGYQTRMNAALRSHMLTQKKLRRN